MDETLAMVLRGIRQIMAATDDEWTRNALRALLEQAGDCKPAFDEERA